MKFIKYDNLEKDLNFVSNMVKKHNLNSKIAEIIVNRGYNTEEKFYNYININENSFLDPFDLLGMDKLVEKLNNIIENKDKVVILGDYDVDGISATFVMIKLFQYYGLNVDFYLPNRFIDGYGLTNQVIDKIKDKFNPNVIITVDCGISCHKEVEYAKDIGIEILITDHHNIQEVIPNTVVVNPKLDNQKYEFKDLCGTGVAFKVAQAMLPDKEWEKLLPVVAIATIADIVSLTDENRLIVYKGLKLMQKHLPFGLKQMFLDNKISLTKPSSVDIAFKIAPKLNASGRMGDADDSLKLYFENDISKAKNQIQIINNHNLKRQNNCNKIYNDCKAMLSKYNISNLRAIILYSSDWDQGILGIVCSKLLEEYRRPVFLFSKNGNELKGSARSIDQINIHNMLTTMSDILTTFGGHSVAAGLALDISNFEEFSKKINSYIATNINDEIFSLVKYYDTEIETNEIDNQFINQLEIFEPCGSNNPKPVFKIISQDVDVIPLKKCPQHANITINKNISAIFFNYTNYSTMLKMCKNHNFILEFQDLKNSTVKANVKSYTCDFDLKDRVGEYVNKLKLSQLSYVSDKTECEYSLYEEKNLINLLLTCNSSAFGTCFICYNIESFKNFINTYELSKIYDFQFCTSETSTGFNSIYLFPENLSFTRNYKNVVFIDNITDSSVINYINKISSAKVYVPCFNKFDKDLYDNLSLKRFDFGKLFSMFSKVENYQFSNIFDVYTTVYNKLKFKISFNNFYFQYLVFKELNIINFQMIDGLYKLQVNKNIKRNLTESKAYNFITLVCKIK